MDAPPDSEGNGAFAPVEALRDVPTLKAGQGALAAADAAALPSHIADKPDSSLMPTENRCTAPSRLAFASRWAPTVTSPATLGLLSRRACESLVCARAHCRSWSLLLFAVPVPRLSRSVQAVGRSYGRGHLRRALVRVLPRGDRPVRLWQTTHDVSELGCPRRECSGSAQCYRAGQGPRRSGDGDSRSRCSVGGGGHEQQCGDAQRGTQLRCGVDDAGCGATPIRVDVGPEAGRRDRGQSDASSGYGHTDQQRRRVRCGPDQCCVGRTDRGESGRNGALRSDPAKCGGGQSRSGNHSDAERQQGCRGSERGYDPGRPAGTA